MTEQVSSHIISLRSLPLKSPQKELISITIRVEETKEKNTNMDKPSLKTITFATKHEKLIS